MKWYLISYYLMLLAGLVAGVIRYNWLAASNRLIVWLLAATLCTELIAKYISSYTNTNLPIYLLFQPLEFILLTYLYWLELRRNWMLWTIPIYLALFALNTIVWQPGIFQSNMLIITMLISSIWSLFYLWVMLQHPTELYFTDFALFWVSCGLLLFNTSCLFVYGAYNFINEDTLTPYNNVFRILRVTANHLLYLLFTIGLVGKQNKLPGWQT